MASRSRLHGSRHVPQKVEDPKSSVDLSLLQMPMSLSITGALQVARCLSSGTAEMRELLTEECDIIFECRVCRNLFRNLPNFIAHKRHYCKECYSDARLRFVEPKPEHETLLIQPQPPKEQAAKPALKVDKNKDREASGTEAAKDTAEKTVKAKQAEKKDLPADKIKEKKDLHTEKIKETKEKNTDRMTNGTAEGDFTKIIVTEGKSEAFKFYTKAAEKVEQKDDLRKRSLVELEDVKGNKNAKKQKIILEADEEDIKAASRKHRGPTHADLAIITESFDRVSNSGDLSSVDGDSEGQRKISLRHRGGSGEVSTPIAERLKKRDDCDVKTQTCLKCKATYSSLKTLHFHMMSLHAERRTVYPCVYAKCKATFTKISTAVRHLQNTHECTKRQIEKMRENLKKFAYTCPIDDIGECPNPRWSAEVDVALLRATKRQQSEAHREKVEKVKKEATDTINHVTKRLADKLKKQKDTLIDFGSGFSLYKCLNCSKAFAKKDSLNRHQAFCFGIGGLDDDKASVSSGRSGRGRSSLTKKAEKLPTTDKNKSNTGTTKTPVKETPKETTVTKEQNAKPKSDSEKVKTPEKDRKMTEVSPKIILERLSPKQVENTGSKESNQRVNIKCELVDQGKQLSAESKVKENDTDQSESEPMSDSINESFESDSSKTDANASRWTTELDETELERVRNLINEDDLQCLKCNRKYGSISNLHRHALRHLGWKRFRCTLCEFTAYNRSECKTHLSRVHMEKTGSNPRKFILDLEPDKMKLGVSARSRVESKRPSSLRILERMQQARKEGRERKSSSPCKAGTERTRRGSTGSDGFNISTRSSPRDYDIRPYKHMESTAVLFTRSGHYPKPLQQNKSGSDEESEIESEKDDAETTQSCAEIKVETPESNNSELTCIQDGDGEMHMETNEISLSDPTGSNTCENAAPQVNAGSEVEESSSIPMDDNSEVCVSEQQPTEATEEIQVIEDSQLIVEQEITEESQVNEGMETTEVIYLVMDEGAEIDPISLTTNDTSVVQTVAIDTNGQLAVNSGEHGIYILDDGLGNFTTSGSEVGYAEEVVVQEEVVQEVETECAEDVIVNVTSDTETAITATEDRDEDRNQETVTDHETEPDSNSVTADNCEPDSSAVNEVDTDINSNIETAPSVVSEEDTVLTIDQGPISSEDGETDTVTDHKDAASSLSNDADCAEVSESEPLSPPPTTETCVGAV